MIKKEDVLPIGRIVKAHGLKGELTMEVTNGVFDDVETEYLICEVDGILVPFFLEEYRFKRDETAFVKFKRIDSTMQADELCGCSVYMERKQLPDDYAQRNEGDNMGDNIDYYVGYTIQQTDGTPLGTIDAVDDSTANILFCVVKPNGSDLIIPASDDYIVEIDDEQKIIKMELPEGLLELDD